MAEFTLGDIRINSWERKELLELLRTEILDAFRARESVRADGLAALNMKFVHGMKEVKK